MGAHSLQVHGRRPTLRRLRAVIDEDGEVSFADLNDETNALAVALGERGIGSDSSVGLLCRNSRWFVLAATALSKAGATTLYLNRFRRTAGAGCARREGAAAVIFDQEFADLVDSAAGDLDRWIAHHDGSTDRETLADLIESARGAGPRPPRARAADHPHVGDHGTPKGASRPAPKGLVNVTSLFQRVPWRVGDIHHVPAPMFRARQRRGI